MKYTKYRANLSDEHMKSLVVTDTSKFDHKFNKILEMQTQLHHSH